MLIGPYKRSRRDIYGLIGAAGGRQAPPSASKTALLDDLRPAPVGLGITLENARAKYMPAVVLAIW